MQPLKALPAIPHKSITHIISAVIILVLLLLAASVASAHGTPDQVNDPPTGFGYHCPPELGSAYQGFTPTADELASVDLRLLIFLQPGGTLPAEGVSSTVRIRTDGPTGTVLGGASASLHESGLTNFDFDPALPLIPGNLYVIEWFVPSPDPENWRLTWAITVTNPYPSGHHWSCLLFPEISNDLNFITYKPQSAPVAHDNGYSTNEDTVLNVAAPGVLGNDTDADGDTLSALLVSGPAHGTLTFNGVGSFTYIPNANFSGSDSFTYKANDGIDDSNVAKVGIEVFAVNDGPVASDDAYSTSENTALIVPAPGVLGNDSDVDGDALCATWESAGGPFNGGIDFNCDGSFTYTPNANFSGSDSFSYQACDSGLLCSTASVTITVADSGPGNGPPSDPGGAVPDNPGNAGGNSNPRACEDNPGRANEHRPANIPPCR